MSKVKNGDKVRIHYTGKLENGKVFDSSDDIDPLEFKIGDEQVIVGLEDAVIGMEQNEKKTIKIPAEKAYGPYHDELVVAVDKSKFPVQITPRLGEKLKVQQPDGKINIFTVIDISEAKVTLDANYPLAGENLTLDIQLVDIVK